jgi:hypothetical protein
MDAFEVVTVWAFAALFGAWTGLALAQVASGRIVFPAFAMWRVWTPREVKLSGWGWLVCGLAGLLWTLIGGLSVGAHVIPLFWVGNPWWFWANPFPIMVILNGLYQQLIDQHHKGRWPFKRAVSG